MKYARMYIDALTDVMAAVVGSSAVLVIGLWAIGLIVPISVGQYSIAQQDVPAHKHFTLHNYISSEDAAVLLAHDPEVLFVDVRDSVEIAQAGRPEPIDAIVPVRVQTDAFDAALQEYVLADNPDFLETMARVIAAHGKTRDDLIIVTCGSGYRSAVAAEKLVEAGYTNVWHIPDGYPGDEKPGLNSHNAWQIAGLAWTDVPFPGGAWQKMITY